MGVLGGAPTIEHAIDLQIQTEMGVLATAPLTCEQNQQLAPGTCTCVSDARSALGGALELGPSWLR